MRVYDFCETSKQNIFWLVVLWLFRSALFVREAEFEYFLLKSGNNIVCKYRGFLIILFVKRSISIMRASGHTSWEFLYSAMFWNARRLASYVNTKRPMLRKRTVEEAFPMSRGPILLKTFAHTRAIGWAEVNVQSFLECALYFLKILPDKNLDKDLLCLLSEGNVTPGNFCFKFQRNIE